MRRLALLAIAAAACGAPSPPAPGEPPVILIVVDTLRADHLTQWGHDARTSTPLDRLVSRSTVFERCLAPSPWTLPSTATIMTGWHPVRHGATAHGQTLPEDVTTLAESLSHHGWRTFGVSFNHNISATTGFDQGFDAFESFDGSSTAYPDISEMVARASDWLDEPPPDGPLFLYLQPMNTHGPYLVPDEQRGVLLGRPPAPGFTYYGKRMSAIMKEGQVHWRDSATPEYLTSLREQYDTAIRYTTEQLAELLARIEDSELYDRALIVVTADHGEELFEHGGFSHGYSLHDEVLHVPLIVKLPGQRAGRRVQDTVSLADVCPTILDVLGLPRTDAVDGRSLARRLVDDREPVAHAATDRRPFLFHVGWKKRCTGTGLLRWPYKLVHIVSDYAGNEDAWSLYDLARDPGETTDIAEEAPEVVAELRAAMRAELDRLAAEALPASRNVLDELDEATLKALGYL